MTHVTKSAWLVAASLVLSFFLPPPSAEAQAVLVVDNDGMASAASCDAATMTFFTIGSAIAASVSGDTVRVCPGTYFENVNFGGKNIALRSVSGPAVTIIDGNAADSVVTFESLEGPAAVLDGFTIRNGRAIFDPPGFGDGGGILIADAAPVVRNNVIVNNRACGGNGIAMWFGSPLIENNTISGNLPTSCGGLGGGGILAVGESTAVIRRNIISGNSTFGGGGGIGLNGAGAIVIERNLITNNSASGVIPCADGGGISIVNQTDARITGNLIAHNQAGCGGGIFWSVPQGEPGPKLVNNTLAENDGSQGSAIFADGYDVSAEIINNIIVAAPGQTALFCGNSNDLNPPVIRFNDIFSASGSAYGGICSDQTGVNGNISADPHFVNIAAGDYHVTAGAPVIDRGDNNVVGLPSVDLDGNVRVIDGDLTPGAVVDIGSDELSRAPTIVLKVNGQHPDSGVVSTSGHVTLTLQVAPTTNTQNVTWYWALIFNGQIFWRTLSGFSSVPAPLFTAPPLVITQATLLDVDLPLGTTFSNAFYMVGGGALVSADVITSVVIQPD